MPDYMPNAYYDAIAAVYDETYHRDDADLRGDVSMIRDVIEQNLGAARVLEVASGTGFWSRKAARVAKSVVGLERSEKMLELAKAGPEKANLSFQQGDAWDLDAISGDFDALTGFFWFSHVPKARINEFLGLVAKRIGPGGVVVFADSLAEPYATPLKPIKGSAGDTCAARDLGEAGKFEVLKNCYDGAEVVARLEESGYCHDVKVAEGAHFWVASYLVPSADDHEFDNEEYTLSEIFEA